MTKKQHEWILNISSQIEFFGFLPPVADWIACQFALESAFGNSRIAKVKHNLCGMKVPHVRPSLNRSTSGFASYINDYDCIVDYVLLLSYNHFGYSQMSNLDCFLAKLKASHYCDDDGYYDSITNLYKQFKNYYK